MPFKCIDCEGNWVDQFDFENHECPGTPTWDETYKETDMQNAGPMPLPGRPDVICPCGSGQWFTQCCWKDKAKDVAVAPPAPTPAIPIVTTSLMRTDSGMIDPFHRTDATVMFGGLPLPGGPPHLAERRTPVAPPPVTLRLDLAAGQTPREGFEGVDVWPGSKHVVDLTQYPWPWADNSVLELNCSHYIEHIDTMYVQHGGRLKEALFAFFDECFRVLVPDGWLHLAWPHNRSDRAFWDPTHRRFIPPQTMLYMNRKWRELQRLDHYAVDCNFGIVAPGMPNDGEGLVVVPIVLDELKLLTPEVAAARLLHYWNVGIDWHAKLQAKK